MRGCLCRVDNVWVFVSGNVTVQLTRLKVLLLFRETCN